MDNYSTSFFVCRGVHLMYNSWNYSCQLSSQNLLLGCYRKCRSHCHAPVLRKIPSHESTSHARWWILQSILPCWSNWIMSPHFLKGKKHLSNHHPTRHRETHGKSDLFPRIPCYDDMLFIPSFEELRLRRMPSMISLEACLHITQPFIGLCLNKKQKLSFVTKNVSWVR